MRNFKKIMALAVSVAAICSSVSAFAELEYTYEGDINGLATYTASSNSLSLDVEGDLYNATVLVLDNDVDVAEATGEDILYINQYTEEETAYSNMGLKGTTALGEGRYAVRVRYEDENGDATDLVGTIVADEKPAETTKVTFVLGDVDADGEAGLGDANYILGYLAGGSKTIAPSTVAINTKIAGDYVLGDVDADGEAGLGDANYILGYLAGGSKTIAPSTVAINTEVVVEVPAN